MILRPALLATFLAFGASAAEPDEPKSTSSPDDVVVKALDAPLAKEEDGSACLDAFFNHPDEMKFDIPLTKDWRKRFEAFAKSLLRKATDQKLDSGSLSKALDLVLKHAGKDGEEDQIAFIPVGAYQATFDKRPVWVVAVKWEYPSAGDDEILMGHVRIFAFDQKTMKRVGFCTCD